MAKLWIGKKLYSVETEVQDYCDKLQGRIEELEAGQLDFAKETTRILKNKVQRILDLEALRDTVSISCHPPKDCNDPEVLKTYMKSCFDEAQRLY